VAIVFWAFRAMVGMGFWFILLAFWGGYRWLTGDLLEDDLLHKALMASSLLGILAVELGWIVTEVGRQPWVIQGVMRTSEGVSPGLTGAEATLTLAGFVLVYATLLGLYAYVVVRIIRAGPPGRDDLESVSESTPPSGPEAPAGVTGDD
jgi:cytochrome d ubiquinol oxidase subunit I